MINHNSKLAQEFWQEGSLKDCPIIDFHAHMGNLTGGYLPECTPEQMLKLMDAANVRKTFFCSHQTLFTPVFGKEKEMNVVQRYPERFKAYLGVVSRHLNPDKDLQLIEDFPDIFAGFKFLCDYYQVPLNDTRHYPYLQYADEHKNLVLSHTWGGSNYNGLKQVEYILERYHNLVFIAGHSFFGEWEKAVEFSRRYPNLYLELTAVLHHRGVLDYFVQEVGSTRILFGVDLPWFDYFHGIGAVLSADITDDDRENILYRNGEKLLKRINE